MLAGTAAGVGALAFFLLKRRKRGIVSYDGCARLLLVVRGCEAYFFFGKLVFSESGELS